jgi:hypothetical protein
MVGMGFPDYPHYLWITMWKSTGATPQLPVDKGFSLRCININQNSSSLIINGIVADVKFSGHLRACNAR